MSKKEQIEQFLSLNEYYTKDILVRQILDFLLKELRDEE